MGEAMIFAENLVKIYKTTETEVVALQGLDLTVEAGEFIAIIGNSGSGKSTLLNLLGGLDRPSAGILQVNGRNLLKFNERDYAQYKRDTVGFVWQNNARNLIPYLTALENVQVPVALSSGRESAKRAKELLGVVGLSHRTGSRLSELSGGEQQRVAIAIALANGPKIMLADEPTGAVDSATAGRIMDTLREVNRELHVTVILVTHDMSLSRKVSRIVAIRDGRASSEFVDRKYCAGDLKGLENLDESDQHVELAVVDAAGHLQIPRDFLECIGVAGRSKVRVEMEGDRVVILNPGVHRF